MTAHGGTDHMLEPASERQFFHLEAGSPEPIPCRASWPRIYRAGYPLASSCGRTGRQVRTGTITSRSATSGLNWRLFSAASSPSQNVITSYSACRKMAPRVNAMVGSSSSTRMRLLRLVLSTKESTDAIGCIRQNGQKSEYVRPANRIRKMVEETRFVCS